MRTIAAPLCLSCRSAPALRGGAPLIALIALAFTLLACTDAGQCTRGEAGCACRQGNECESGLSCSAQKMCVERSSAGSGGRGGSGGTGGDAECSQDSFADACEGFCQALCSNQEAMCLGSACGSGDCGPAACAEACDDDVDCMYRACMAQLEMTCETFGAKDTGSGVFKSFCFENDPTCVVSPDLGCSDTCGTLSSRTGGDLADNDACEDGGKDSTGTAKCARGTDCSDCGTRACGAPLEKCTRNGDCCGFTAGESFCVDTGGGQVCLATCSETKPCDGAALCTPLREGGDAVCVE